MKRKEFLKGLGLFSGGMIVSKLFHPLKAEASVKDTLSPNISHRFILVQIPWIWNTVIKYLHITQIIQVAVKPNLSFSYATSCFRNAPHRFCNLSQDE